MTYASTSSPDVVPRLSVRAIVLAVLALLCSVPSAFSVSSPAVRPPAEDRRLSDFPENAEFRTADYAGFITALPAELGSFKPTQFRNGWGSWRRERIRSGGYDYLVYVAQRGSDWPLYSQGSWIIKRRTDGTFVQAKIFLKSDPGTFLRVRPDGDRSRFDLVVKGGVFAQDVPLPWPFEHFLVSKVADLIDAARGSVDWSFLDPDPLDSHDVATLSEEIRARLSGLRYSDDGGLDANGSLVFIATGAGQPEKTAGLNCSGFAQWVVDGILKPVSGIWLDRSVLSLKHIDTRKSASEPSFEDSLDPYFGLDWTRNLAIEAGAVLDGLEGSDSKAADVTHAPFALIEAASSPVNGGPEYANFAPYEEDAGFASEGIPALLWWLAATEPGYFYLASISEQDKAGLRHHYHVSLLFPRFAPDGSFHVDVYESDVETSLTALIARTKGQMIHLVRVRAETAFDPPALGPVRLP